jgi:hypothetical protein
MTQRTTILGLLLLACLFGGQAVARAQSPQSAVGGNQRLSVGGFVSANRIDYGQFWLGGFGVSADANLTWRYGIEGEANWARFHQLAGTQVATYLVGPRYQFAGMGRDYKYRPYAKFLVGDGRFTFPYGFGYGNYFVMAPGAGLDYRLNYHFRLRLCDVEWRYWPNFTFGSMSNIAITTGIRYNIR